MSPLVTSTILPARKNINTYILLVNRIFVTVLVIIPIIIIIICIIVINTKYLILNPILITIIGQKYEISAISVKLIGDCPSDSYPLQKKRHSQGNKLNVIKMCYIRKILCLIFMILFTII